jgi:hypothetical protein
MNGAYRMETHTAKCAAHLGISVHQTPWVSKLLDSQFLMVQGIGLQPGSFGLKQARVGQKSTLIAARCVIASKPVCTSLDNGTSHFHSGRLRRRLKAQFQSSRIGTLRSGLDRPISRPRGRVRIELTNAVRVLASHSFNSTANIRRYDPSSRSARPRQ